MARTAEVPDATPQRPPLGVFPTQAPASNVARWRINGFPASIIVWTAEEWERLTVRPSDAQYIACGIWCALRVE